MAILLLIPNLTVAQDFLTAHKEQLLQQVVTSNIEDIFFLLFALIQDVLQINTQGRAKPNHCLSSINGFSLFPSQSEFVQFQNFLFKTLILFFHIIKF
ncbi:Uncharacterised protein [Segatella copri]|nr:Uncharacterised protein [Segatella copri]